MKRQFGALTLAIGLWAVAGAQIGAGTQEAPDRDAFVPAQAAADLIREKADADIAFLPAGIMYREFSGDDLGKLVKYPTETLHVSKLTGAQVKQALSELENSRSQYMRAESNYAIYKLDGALADLREAARLMESEVRRRRDSGARRAVLTAP